MENGPFICDFPNKTSIHAGFSIAMFEINKEQQMKEQEALRKQHVARLPELKNMRQQLETYTAMYITI